MKKGIDCTGVAIVTFCHDGEGNYVFSKRSKKCRDEHERWENAGGGALEFGETVEETLRREVKEEICADVLNFEFLGHRDVHREHEGKKTHWIALDFKVHVNREQVAIGEPDMSDELRWATIDNVPQPQHSQLHIFMENYRGTL